MDEESYKKAYYSDPMPDPLYRFVGGFSVALFFSEFEAAVFYYSAVFGPPAYSEGKSTRGWQIGTGWLTLLRGKGGAPTNVEIILEVDTPAEAERLQSAFIKAGGQGPVPSDQLMYHAVRYCPVVDKFGTNLLIISRL